MSLIREKAYQDIDIQAITERANTARVTFYRHYASKDELLIDYLERLYLDLQESIGTFCYERLFDTQSPPSTALFELIARDKDLYRRLLHSPMGMTIQNRVRYYIVEHITRLMAESPHLDDKRVAWVAHHIASCTLGNIGWWLTSDDAPPFSAQQMTVLTQTLAVEGLKTLLENPGEFDQRLVVGLPT